MRPSEGGLSLFFVVVTLGSGRASCGDCTRSKVIWLGVRWITLFGAGLDGLPRIDADDCLIAANLRELCSSGRSQGGRSGARAYRAN